MKKNPLQKATTETRTVNDAFTTIKPFLTEIGWRYVPRNIKQNVRRGKISQIESEALKFEIEKFEATIIPYRGGIEFSRAVNNYGRAFIGVFEVALVKFLIQHGIKEIYMQPYDDELFDSDEKLHKLLPIIEYNLNKSGYKKIDGEYRAELDFDSFLELPHEEQVDFQILHKDATEYHKQVAMEYIELSVDFTDHPGKGFRTNVNIIDQQNLHRKLNDCIQTLPCSDEMKEFIEAEFMKIFGSENPTFSSTAEELYEIIGEFLFNIENQENYKEMIVNIGFCLILLHNLEFKRENLIIEGFELCLRPDSFYTEPMVRDKKNNRNKKMQNEFIEDKNAMKLPLPADVSWALNAIQLGINGQLDKYIRLPEKEIMSEPMYNIFAGGVKNNMPNLKLTKKIWENIKGLSSSIASGKAGIKYNIYADFRFRIHLEAIRLITRKSLMEILYLGEINVQNEFDETDFELYLKVCDKIWSLVEKNPDLDLSTLTLKDIQKDSKLCA